MVTLQDVFTILIGTATLGAIFAIGGWIWEHRIQLANRYLTFDTLQRWDIPIMESMWVLDNGDNGSENDEDSPATTTPQNTLHPIADAQDDSNDLLLAKGLAKMIKAGKVGQTDGIQIMFGVKPSSTNKRYQTIRDAVQFELKALDNPYPNRTPEQEQRRKELELTR